MKKSEIIKLYISDLKSLTKGNSDAMNSRISDLIEEKESDQLLVDSILDTLNDLKDGQNDHGILNGINKCIAIINKFYNQKL